MIIIDFLVTEAVVAQGQKRVNSRDSGSIPIRGNEIFNISIPCSDNLSSITQHTIFSESREQKRLNEEKSAVKLDSQVSCAYLQMWAIEREAEKNDKTAR